MELKFVKLEILSTSFIDFLYEELGELRSRSLELKFVKLEIISTSFIDFLYDKLVEGVTVKIGSKIMLILMILLF